MKRVSWTNVLAVLLALWLGAYCSASGQERVVFRGLQPLVPDAVIRGVWYHVQTCLRDWRLSPDSVRWGVADVIVDVQGRRLLYGVNALVHWPDGAAVSVVMERQVLHNARVLSHEIVHAAKDVPDGDWRIDACTLRDGPYALDERPLTAEQLAVLIQGVP